MIAAAKDTAPVAVSQYAAMAACDLSSKSNSANIAVIHIPAIEIINARSDFNATMGVISPWLRTFVRRLPWFNIRSVASKNVVGIAVAAVTKRLATPTDRVDLLSRLSKGKDDRGKPMGIGELTAEALTQLLAGSDTISKSAPVHCSPFLSSAKNSRSSSCAIARYLAANPSVQRTLQKELDEALSSEDDIASTFDQVKRLTYLAAVINESLQIHSTLPAGLPRIAPAGGITLPDGHHFPGGTILSVPTYTIHRDREIWGKDVDLFRPERWFEGNVEGMQKTFNAFSFGPRACVGRNLANMELLIIISSVLRRYEFVLEEPTSPLETSEGLLMKPVNCKVGIKRRNVL